MRANESVSGEGEGGGPQAGLRLRLSIPGATVSCTPRRCCVSVLQRARHSCVSRARTHTHAYACTQVERHIRGFTWPCTHALARHTYTRGIVERCAYVHEARARVPRSTHLFLSVRDTPISGDRGDRDSSTTRVCLSKPARVSKVHSAGYEGCDSFLPSEEREKRERGDLEWNFEWNFVRKFVDCGITGYWNRDRRRSWTIG